MLRRARLCRSESYAVNTESSVCWIFSARQHICYSALYAIARPFGRPSVCLSVTRVDQSKTVEARITQPSPQSSPMTLVSCRGTAPWNSNGKIGNGGAKYDRGMKKNVISATAGIVFRFTRRRCYRALTVALAGLSCLCWITLNNASDYLANGVGLLQD